MANKGVYVIAGVMLVAGLHGSHGTHGGGTVASLLSTSAVPAPAGGYTPSSWAAALLSDLGDPRTRCNMNAITAWEAAEGGNWNNSAAFNPINTTLPEPGSSPMNSAGVQSYTSWQQGMQATVSTLGNGDYNGILAALRAGNSAQAVASAEAASPWGTGPFATSC